MNLPRPIQVMRDELSGQPRMPYEQNRHREIARIQDFWQVDDEWWREPISRRYLQVLLRDGALRTIFHDRIANCWFAQAY